ncbi:MAG: MerR family transcriptional regulator [Myxococcales bacterium]|nr:MerR family transcriptional regulator [Myxococcales bacterium]
MSDLRRRTLYPMRLVTRMTGLSADTIRAWERRHQAVTPARTEGNTRRYSAVEVRRLLLLREATQRGHSIGSIARLDADELERLLYADEPGLELIVGQLHRDGDPGEAVVQAYLGAISRYDSRSAFELLSRASGRLNRARFVEVVLLGIAAEIVERWSGTSGAFSHRQLFLHHLHALVMSYVRAPAPGLPEPPKVAVVTDPGANHELWSLVALGLIGSLSFEPIHALGSCQLAKTSTGPSR